MYDRPLKFQKITLGRCSISASEAQLAALMGLSAHASAYKLWYNYAIARQRLELPTPLTSPVPANRVWRAAKNAVIGVGAPS